MPFIQRFQRILFLIIIIGAVTGQKRQQSRDHYEFTPTPAYPTLQLPHYEPLLQPYAYVYTRFIPPQLPDKQYNAAEKPKHQFEQAQYQSQSQSQSHAQSHEENGNSLAAREIAMEMLSDTLPPPYKDKPPNANDAMEYFERSLAPPRQKDLFELLEKKNNFRRSNGEGMLNKMFSKNLDWHENAYNHESNEDNDDNPKPIITGDSLTLDTINGTRMRNRETETTLSDSNPMDDVNIGILYGISRPHPTNELQAIKDNAWRKVSTKRDLSAIEDRRNGFTQPHYPFAFYTGSRMGDEGNSNDFNIGKQRSSKRERIHSQRTTFIPSISTGAISHLGHFFNDLSQNVRFNERNEFHEAQSRLLSGDHPLRMLQNEVIDESDDQAKIAKTAEFLQAIRSYRPSQKIRSLVSMNPQGYHGSNFLDPNYMWVGLG